MNVISTTIEFNGYPVKIEGGRVFLRAFGTTMYNKTMHWSWAEVKIDNLKPELKDLLIKKGLITNN